MSLPSSSPRRRVSALRAAFSRVHSVDKGLLLFMLVLLIQSAWGLLHPVEASGVASDIDVMVRTSSAAIFGYFLSANFIRHTSDGGQAPASAPPRILETESGSAAQARGPVAQIGFSAGEADTQPAQTSVLPSASSGCSRLQVAVATAIGLFCLVVLLTLRHLILLEIIPADGLVPASTVTQFRDFVSGCIGFLIGCPTQQTNSNL